MTKYRFTKARRRALKKARLARLHGYKSHLARKLDRARHGKRPAKHYRKGMGNQGDW